MAGERVARLAAGELPATGGPVADVDGGAKVGQAFHRAERIEGHGRGVVGRVLVPADRDRADVVGRPQRAATHHRVIQGQRPDRTPLPFVQIRAENRLVFADHIGQGPGDHGRPLVAEPTRRLFPHQFDRMTPPAEAEKVVRVQDGRPLARHPAPGVRGFFLRNPHDGSRHEQFEDRGCRRIGRQMAVPLPQDLEGDADPGIG